MRLLDDDDRRSRLLLAHPSIVGRRPESPLMDACAPFATMFNSSESERVYSRETQKRGVKALWEKISREQHPADLQYLPQA